MALIKCKKCGQPISDKATTCVHCGAKIDSQKKNNRLFLIIGIVLIIIVIIGAIIILRPKEEIKPYVGKYTNEITYVDYDNETVVNSDIELKKDKTFIYHSSMNDVEPLVIEGTYSDTNDEIYLYYELEDGPQHIRLYIDNDKLCFSDENCEDYFIKEGSTKSNKITIRNKEIYITYEQYQEILDNKEKVIVIATLDGCPHCESLKQTVGAITDIETPIYYFNNTEGIIEDIVSFPTTLLIENGKIVDRAVGSMNKDTFMLLLNKNHFN